MHPNAIEKTLFAGDIPAPSFTVTQAKYKYNLSVHALLWFCFGLSTYTLPENAWDFYPATPR
jgi:hypothetical protein